jgi:hypothetical protein
LLGLIGIPMHECAASTPPRIWLTWSPSRRLAGCGSPVTLPIGALLVRVVDVAASLGAWRYALAATAAARDRQLANASRLLAFGPRPLPATAGAAGTANAVVIMGNSHDWDATDQSGASLRNSHVSHRLTRSLGPPSTCRPAGRS